MINKVFKIKLTIQVVLFVGLSCMMYNLKAQSNFRDSLQILIAKNSKKTEGFIKDTLNVRFLNELSQKYYNRNNKPDSILIVANQVKNIGEKWGWNKGRFIGDFLLGLGHKSKMNFYIASENFYRSLHYAEKLNEPAFIGDAYLELANCYEILEQYKNAHEYFNKAIGIFKKINNKAKLALCYNNLASSYLSKSVYKEALALFDLSESIYNTINVNPTILGSINQNRAIVFIELNEFEKAKKYLSIARKYYQLSSRSYFIAKNYSRFGQLFFKENQLSKAIYNSSKAIEIAKKSQEEKQFLESYEVAYKGYLKMGNFSKSILYLEEMMKLKDELNEMSIAKRIESLKYEYDNIKQKEVNEIQELQLKTEKKYNLYLIFGLFLLGGFVSILFFVNKRIRKQKLEIENQREEINSAKKLLEELNLTLEDKIQQRTKQLTLANEQLTQKNREIEEALFKGQTIERRRLASQLHDNLGGHITAIKWSLMAINKEQLSDKEYTIYNNVLKMIGEAYDEVRYISHNLLPDEFNKEGLKGALMKLLKALDENPRTRFTFEMNNYERNDIKVEFEIYCILLELINNIIKYANSTIVLVRIVSKNEFIFIRIENDGLKFDPTTFVSASGQGLKNLTSRINQLNAKLMYKLIRDSNILNIQIRIV